MKTLTFHNIKGGVGKSSFTILYASFLAYRHGIKVGVADIDTRINSYRKDEYNAKKRNGTLDNILETDPWVVAPVDYAAVKKYRNEYLPGYATWLEKEIRQGSLKDCDVVLIDLPGAVSGGEAPEIIAKNLIGLYVIPTDRDSITLRVTVRTKNMINDIQKQIANLKCNYCAFINQIQPQQKKSVYVQMAEILRSSGLPVLPDMIAYSERMKKIDDVDIMRSTFSYPDWENPLYEGSKDLGIDNLFIDITKLLAKTEDITGTKETDLSFIETVEKKCGLQDLNRQLNGTAFPELEIELPEDMKTSFKKKY